MSAAAARKTLNGIEVVSVGGNSAGEFTQKGRIVAGAYDYTPGTWAGVVMPVTGT